MSDVAVLAAEEFARELEAVLPPDIPERARVVELGARHLGMVVEINKVMNVTRIVGAREAAIKHVLDSLLPWRLMEKAGSIVDVGSGAGFPGVPLAVAFPGKRVALVESTQKKARFLQEVVDELQLENAEVHAERGEDFLRNEQFDLLVARAVAPLPKFLEVFGKSLGRVKRLILYKGPEIEDEISEARMELKKRRLECGILIRHELPEGSGVRTILEIHGKG